MPTVLWAFGFLFFFQLFTLYVESIYRLSLTKLSMGPEMYGVFFILAPLLVLLLGRHGARFLSRIAIAGILFTRCLAPYLGARAQIVNSGIGVACFLVLFCYVLSSSNRFSRPDWASAIVLAVLGSVILRSSIWSTFDLSLDPAGFAGATAVFAVLIVLARSALKVSASPDASVPEPNVNVDSGAFATAISSVLVLFPSLVLLYLIATSPGVVSAWSGCNYSVVIVLATLSWMAAACVAAHVSVGRGMLAFWNVLFLTSLLAGIFANRVAFPATPDAPALIVAGDAWWQHIPLYVMLLLSPVLAFNAARVLERPCASVRLSAAAVLIGGLLLLLLPILLVFSNVWAYVQPVSGMLRNKFYLPFLLAGVLILIGLAFSGARTSPGASRVRAVWVRGAAAVLGIVFLAWFGFNRTVLARVPSVEKSGAIDRLRVMTYNYQQGSELNGDQCYLTQMRLIARINPDILFLQESDTPRPSGGNVDSPRLFADALGYYLYFGPKTVTNTFGTAILSRFPLENPRTIFTYSDTDEVGTSMAEIEAGGRRIALFDNHPGGSDAVMHAHADALVSEAKGHKHVIAAGDFNFQQTTPYYAKVTAVLQDSWLVLRPDAVGTPETILGGNASDSERFNMSDRIDHVFATKTFKPTEAQYILTPESKTDHPLYWCELLYQ
ncbi:MAG: endonuclease/exonuclease/phosphatase family protein [Candidatus Hydrogenedentes bacterium]|nr:endonuclease/exonuclease/phosphatase family protein [Candidatus Hydrogenedentota bacterium]